jgi:hypothetical protein
MLEVKHFMRSGPFDQAMFFHPQGIVNGKSGDARGEQ